MKLKKLNREDINFHSQSVVVHGKGGKEREVYFNVWCDIWLKRYLDERLENDQALFVTERKPQHRLSIDLMRYIIKRIPKVQYMKEQNPESIANFFLGFCGPVSRLVFIYNFLSICSYRIFRIFTKSMNNMGGAYNPILKIIQSHIFVRGMIPLIKIGIWHDYRGTPKY